MKLLLIIAAMFWAIFALVNRINPGPEKTEPRPATIQILSSARQGSQVVHTAFTADLDWEKMSKFGQSVRKTREDDTLVYFFTDAKTIPDISKAGDISKIDFQAHPSWVATYRKFPTGDEDFISNKGENNIADTFEKIGYWRKENTRVYSVFTPHLDWTAMSEYAKSREWDEGGTTIVYFFNSRENTPNISEMENPYEWSDKHKPYWVAIYSKYPKGPGEFIQYPAKK